MEQHQRKYANTADFYKNVTAKVVAHIEKGDIPWRRPWTASSIIPVNAITKKAYSGANVIVLWAEQLERGYPSAEWLTFRQAQSVKASVKKGEKAAHVMYYGREVLEDDNGNEVTKPYVRIFSVFNRAQLDALPKEHAPLLLPSEDERYVSATEYLKATGVPIQNGGREACYYPEKDAIRLPEYSTFENDAAFFSVAAHELTHAGGHKTRCDRQLDTKFRSPAYAFEELIALS